MGTGSEISLSVPIKFGDSSMNYAEQVSANIKFTAMIEHQISNIFLYDCTTACLTTLKNCCIYFLSRLA
jgi:hypothetical protein